MMASFGEMLKQARKAKKVTLRELGAYVGKSISYLSDIESDRKRPPDLETVSKIEEFIGLEEGKLVNIALRLRKNKDLAQRIMRIPKLSEALLRADRELTPEEFNEWMEYLEKIKSKREE